jgi:Mrp family chromosome partitioning ATPase
MPQNVSESELYHTLAAVKHPEIAEQNLVKLGMIPAIDIEGERVRVTLALPVLEMPIRETLIELIREAITGVDAALEVEVETVQMTPQQRADFHTRVRGFEPRAQPGRQIKHVVAVASGKGGVGKSSVAAMLATWLRRRELAIGVLDADITGPSIPMMFGAHQTPMAVPEGLLPVESRTGIKLMSINLLLEDESQPVVWRGPLISRTIEQFWRDIVWGTLDYLVVDLPPGTADAALTVTQALPLDGMVLVTSPQDLAGMVVRKAANMADHLGVPLLGLVENMSHVACPNCGVKINVFGPSHGQETARSMGTTLLGQLPLNPDLARLCDGGMVEDFRSETFDAITERLLEIVSQGAS